MNKSKEEVINTLCEIIKYDIGTVFSYNQALNHIDDEAIYASIESLRDDHIRHVHILTIKIESLGGKPPNMYDCLQALTSLKGVLGTRGALKAMKRNEALISIVYKNALSMKNIPQDIMNIIIEHYKDEKCHMKYIIRTLKSFVDMDSRFT